MGSIQNGLEDEGIAEATRAPQSLNDGRGRRRWLPGGLPKGSVGRVVEVASRVWRRGSSLGLALEGLFGERALRPEPMRFVIKPTDGLKGLR